jgi:hypothetical protein
MHAGDGGQGNADWMLSTGVPHPLRRSRCAARRGASAASELNVRCGMIMAVGDQEDGLWQGLVNVTQGGQLTRRAALA